MPLAQAPWVVDEEEPHPVPFLAVGAVRLGGQLASHAWDLYEDIGEPALTDCQMLSQAASQENEHLPMRLDSETEMMNVEPDCEGKALVYNSRLVNYATDHFKEAGVSPSDLLDFVQPNGTNAVCTDPDIRHALKMGVNFRYRFFDKGRRYSVSGSW